MVLSEVSSGPGDFAARPERGVFHRLCPETVLDAGLRDR